MTAKEKANELLDKFWLMDKVQPMPTKEQARQCALIVVDEIRDNSPLISDIQQYWIEVKKEIGFL